MSCDMSCDHVIYLHRRDALCSLMCIITSELITCSLIGSTKHTRPSCEYTHSHTTHTHTHTHTQGSVPIWYILSNFNQFSTHTTHTTPTPPTHTPPTDSLSFPHSYQIRIQCTLVREGEQSLLRSYDVVTALLTLLRDMYVTTTPTHTPTHTHPHTQVI